MVAGLMSALAIAAVATRVNNNVFIIPGPLDKNCGRRRSW
jgi:hypothetical protein